MPHFSRQKEVFIKMIISKKLKFSKTPHLKIPICFLLAVEKKLKFSKTPHLKIPICFLLAVEKKLKFSKTPHLKSQFVFSLPSKKIEILTIKHICLIICLLSSRITYTMTIKSYQSTTIIFQQKQKNLDPEVEEKISTLNKKIFDKQEENTILNKTVLNTQEENTVLNNKILDIQEENATLKIELSLCKSKNESLEKLFEKISGIIPKPKNIPLDDYKVIDKIIENKSYDDFLSYNKFFLKDFFMDKNIRISTFGVMKEILENENIHVIKYIIDHCDNLEYKDKDGWNFMHYACRFSIKKIISHLFNKNIIIGLTRKGFSPLAFLCKFGSFECINKFLPKFDINGVDIYPIIKNNDNISKIQRKKFNYLKKKSPRKTRSKCSYTDY